MFVVSPMGYGKSISVRQYLAEYGIDHIWVSALPNNDTLVWKNICAAITAMRGEAGHRLTDIGFPMARYLLPQVIDALTQAAARPFVIVIDDCHLLAESSPTYHLLYALAMEHIAGLRIICITRCMPGWLLAQMRAKELCAVIAADTLSFNKSEAFSYLRLRKALPASAAGQAEKIWEVSEGWIAAIVLLAEGVRQGRDVTPLKSIHDLFEYTLFKDINENERVLLVKLAVLGEFSLPQAEFILETPEITSLIERLYEQNEFITHNHSTGAYKMHSLLRGFLTHKAVAYAVNTRAVLLNLARWEYTQGQYGDSFSHYHQSGHVTEFFERLTIEERVHIPFDPQDTLYDIFRSLPPETILRIPLIYTYVSLHFLASGIQERERFALKCMQYLRRHFVHQACPHPQQERIACELQIVLHVAHFNDPYRGMDLRKCTCKSVLREVVRPFASTTSLSAGLPSLLYCFYRRPGELDSLIAFVEQHFDCDVLEGLGYGFDRLLHAEKHLERGDMEKARLCAMQAIQKGWLREQMHIIACAHAVLVRIALLEGNSEEAIAQLDVIKFGIIRRLSFTPPPELRRLYATIGELCELYIYCALNNAKHLESCVPNLHTFGNDYPYKGLGMPMLFKIKYKIIRGEFAEAEVLCDFYEKEFTRYPTQLGRLRHKIYRTIINTHLYGPDAAIAVLSSALEEAAMDGVVTPFAEHADFINPLLETLSPTELLPQTYLNTLREVCLRISDNRRRLRTPTATDLLTRREAEVFQLLARGLSQKNIAETLHISIPTVKRHLEKIYSKLGVNNRVAALNKGLMLELQ